MRKGWGLLERAWWSDTLCLCMDFLDLIMAAGELSVRMLMYYFESIMRIGVTAG